MQLLEEAISLRRWLTGALGTGVASGLFDAKSVEALGFNDDLATEPVEALGFDEVDEDVAGSSRNHEMRRCASGLLCANMGLMKEIKASLQS